MKSALIVGIDSTLGRFLAQELFLAGWTVFGTTRRKENVKKHIFYLDLANYSTYKFDYCVDVVFLCACITTISASRGFSEYSRLINRDAQIALAEYFTKKSIQVVFLSTTAVFNGQKPTYKIEDATCPSTAYGEYKAVAEREILSMSNTSSIVRLSKILTPDYPLIVRWIQSLTNNEVIMPFFDLSVCPLALKVVTYCLKEIAERKLYGIIHLSGEKDVTYCDIARYLADGLGAGHLLIKSKSALDSGLIPSEIPRYTSLDMTESKKLFGLGDLSLDIILYSLYKDRLLANQKTL